LSNQTPQIPPSIDTMNITKSTMVLEDVGNTSEAIRLAEEPAGDANKKRMIMKVYLQKRF